MSILTTRQFVLAIVITACFFTLLRLNTVYRPPDYTHKSSWLSLHNNTRTNFLRYDTSVINTSYTTAELAQKKHFIEAELKSDNYDFSGLTDLCNRVQWTHDVVFTCDNNAGGVGNVRNHMLNCIRYAIEAGGSLVYPRIIVRNTNDPADIYTNDLIDMEYLFDRDHFKNSLNEFCPQLRLHKTPPVGGGVNLFPEGLDNVGKTGLKHPSEWRNKFNKWFRSHPSKVVHLDRSYLTYPVHHDSPLFVNNYGGILQFRSDFRQLAAQVLYNLKRITLNSAEGNSPTMAGVFLGVHLRTESDALKFWKSWPFGTFEEQTDVYFEQAVRSNLSLVYVASGDPQEIIRFQQKTPVLTIMNKEQLLNAEDKKVLLDMTFDQQALIDYLVLLKASQFGGVAQSSFSWNIALKRHLSSNAQDHLQLDGLQMWSDEVSMLYGSQRKEPKYEACMWP